MRKVIRKCCLLLSILLAAVPVEARRACLVAPARSAGGQEWPEKLAQLEQRVTEAKSSADNAAIAWSVAECIKNGGASASGRDFRSRGRFGGLHPEAAGFVAPLPALVIGLVAGGGCYLMVTRVKTIFGYDDAPDAFGVHGAGGTIGALVTGVFATEAINPIDGLGKAVGGRDGHWSQLGNQLVGVLTVASVGTIIVLKVVDWIIGVRVSEEHETQGLDLTQHGEEAYNLET